MSKTTHRRAHTINKWSFVEIDKSHIWLRDAYINIGNTMGGGVIGWGNGGDCWFAWTKFTQQINTIKRIVLRERKCRRWKVLFSMLHIFIWYNCECLYLCLSVCAFVESLHSGAICWCVRFVCTKCDTHSEWKLFSVILEIKFSMNTCSLMYRQIRRRLGRSPNHPSTPQQSNDYGVCMGVCMYCSKAFELCSAWQTHFI